MDPLDIAAGGASGALAVVAPDPFPPNLGIILPVGGAAAGFILAGRRRRIMGVVIGAVVGVAVNAALEQGRDAVLSAPLSVIPGI